MEKIKLSWLQNNYVLIGYRLIFAAALEKANLSADKVSAVSKAALSLYNYVLATIHHCEENNKAD